MKNDKDQVKKWIVRSNLAHIIKTAIECPDLKDFFKEKMKQIRL